VKEKLGRWGLVAVSLLGFMCSVNLYQAQTIQKQRTELVAQFKTLIGSQQHEVKMSRDLNDMDKKFQATIAEMQKTCKSK